MKVYSILLIIVFSLTTKICPQVQFIPHTITTEAKAAEDVYAVDVDGDGDMDVLSASIFDDKIAWYENDGNENFTSHTITTDADGPRSVFAIDVDGDGYMDVLSASRFDSTIAWYENSLLSDTLHVPGEYPTIQAAIDEAINGDIVLVAEDIYFENINFKGKAITVTSNFLIDGNESHISNTIINGSQPSHPDSASVVYFISGEDTTSVLYGLTITGGKGSIYNYEGSIRRMGGGIYLVNSGARIENNIIEFNSIDHTSDSWGGGIGAVSDVGPNYIVENNVIRNNNINTPNVDYNSLGGGAYLYTSGYAKVVNNKIIENKITAPTGYGGGLSPYGGANFVIDNNFIDGNEVDCSTGGSGGIDIYYPHLIRNNLIVNNSAPAGGGLYIEIPQIKKSSLDGRASKNNSSLVKDDVPIIENNTIADNTAVNYGGGVAIIYPIVPQLMNCIVWGNYASSTPQIYGVADVQYSDIESGYTGTGNIDSLPLFDGSEYYLLGSTSPCIDAGNPDPIYFDVGAGGNALPPAQGSVLNDMGHCGGPASLWYLWDWPMPVEDNSLVVSEFILMQNYPNPFNPTTTIRYMIPKRALVTIKIYDILGDEITTLVNEEKTVGNYEVEFIASNLSSGVYFYQLTVGDFIQTKKMILLR
ncbi:MAG: T9SS type A sorting domain-containing protein [Ignavibacteriaceae bacterium]|nr:T9SS type A sorting domain-containing protein [Ignavibacteriaceae bacterium]